MLCTLMTALPSWSYYPLKIKNQQTPSRSKCKFWAPTLVSKLNPFFRPGRLAKFSPLKRRSPLLSTINAWSTNFNVICATQIMSGTLPDIYTSALTNINTGQSGGILSNTAYWRLIWLTSNFLSWRNVDLSLIVFKMLKANNVIHDSIDGGWASAKVLIFLLEISISQR